MNEFKGSLVYTMTSKPVRTNLKQIKPEKNVMQISLTVLAHLTLFVDVLFSISNHSII